MSVTFSSSRSRCSPATFLFLFRDLLKDDLDGRLRRPRSADARFLRRFLFSGHLRLLGVLLWEVVAYETHKLAHARNVRFQAGQGADGAEFIVLAQVPCGIAQSLEQLLIEGLGFPKHQVSDRFVRCLRIAHSFSPS